MALHDPRDEGDYVPHNIEAEIALLGCILFQPEILPDVEPLVAPEDFFEPFHQRLFAKMLKFNGIGRIPDPVTLRSVFAIDQAFIDLGGIRYFSDLVDRAPPASNAYDYAREIAALASRREAIRIASSVIHSARDPELSGSDLMAELEKGVAQARTGRQELRLVPWAEVGAEIVEGLGKPRTRELIKTGLAKIDKLIGGGERGDLIVLGARPSMGKSALASCIALNVAESGGGAAEVNGEMSKYQMGRRHLTDKCFRLYEMQCPTYRDIRLGNLTPHQMDLLRLTNETMTDLPLVLVKRTGLKLAQLRSLLRRQKALFEAQERTLDLVVVDHVGLVRPDESGRGRYDDQTVISNTLKEIADELGVVMLALAQLNRQVEQREDKRPQLADLRDSGSWEQDADVVLGVYRDAYYAQREREPKGRELADAHFLRQTSKEIEVIGLKVREGEPGTAKLWANIGRNAIRDNDPDALLISDPSLF